MRRLKFRGGSSAVDTNLIDEIVAFVEHRIEDRVFEQFIYRHDTLEDLLGPDLYMVAISIRWNHPPAVDAVRNRLARLGDSRHKPGPAPHPIANSGHCHRPKPRKPILRPLTGPG